MVRKAKNGENADHFIRMLGCADQHIFIVGRTPTLYNKAQCEFPKLVKYAFDYDCDWPADVLAVSTTTMDQTSFPGTANVYEEECAAKCHQRAALSAKRANTPRNMTGCKSWVVKNLHESTPICEIAESTILHPLGSSLA